MSKGTFAHLKIESIGDSGESYNVWLNGHDISSHVSTLSLDLRAGSPGLATLTLFVGELDLDARTAVLVKGDVLLREADEPATSR